MSYCLTCAAPQEANPLTCPRCEAPLVLELAKRLYDARNPGYERFEAISPHVVCKWMDVADECLRQMEWVRQGYLLKRVAEGRHDAPRWAYEVYSEIRDGDLTLAPEGWKPE